MAVNKFTASCTCFTPKSDDVIINAAKADVRVRIAGRIVQIQRESASVRSIVPITTTKSGAASCRRFGPIPFHIYLPLSFSMIRMIVSLVP